MGMTQTLDEQYKICGGIDFAHLKHLPLGELSGSRTPSFQLIVRQSVLNRIRSHGDASSRVEVCGVLVGDVYRDDIGAFTLVEHIIEGQASAGSAGQVTFTADTWQHIQTLMDKQYPDLRIVGWYHTHPGHGVFLSEMDIFLHESFFGLPWQAALVYDPKRHEVGLFSAQQGVAQELVYLVEADEAADVTYVRQPAPSESVLDSEPVLSKKPLVQTPRPSRTLPVLGKSVLAIIGLLLFICMGALLGLLIKMQHIEMPYWIQRMAHG